MSDLRISEHTKISGGADFAALADSREVSQVVLWDMGPPKPQAPQRPKAPVAGKEGDPEHDLAMIEFKEQIGDYEAALKQHRADKIAYDKFQKDYGGPYEISMWSCDAQDSLARDPKRYLISSSTRGHEKLRNQGLPIGIRPGHGQAAQEERERQGLADLNELKRRDPVFGTPETRA